MTFTSDEQQRFGLGAIDQISFAVRDMDDAVPRFTAMFGPFAVIDVPDLEVVVHGKPAKTSLRLGFGTTGSIEVELVQVFGGPWPTLEWLDRHGEGLHHLRYRVADIAGTCAEMTAAGFEVTVESAEGSFFYLTAPPLNDMTIELLKAPA